MIRNRRRGRMKNYIIFSIILNLIMICLANFTYAFSIDEIEITLQNMSIEQKVGQLFFVGLTGKEGENGNGPGKIIGPGRCNIQRGACRGSG